MLRRLVPAPHRLPAAVVLAVTAILAPGIPANAQTPLPHTLSVGLSTARAAARPVAVSALLSYEMQCGYPGPGPVVLAFPAAEHVPTAISASAVLVDGKKAQSVHVSGSAVTVALAPPPQVMCDVIGPGRLTIELSRAAGLGNPARPGNYTVRATRGATSFMARITVRAG